MTGCAPEEESPGVEFGVGDCGPEDQRASYNPPVPLSLGETRVNIVGFSPLQAAQIARAADVWNDYGETKIGKKLFSYSYEGGEVSDARGPSARSDCDGLATGPQAVEVLSIQDDDRWRSLGLSGSNPGLTLRCYLDNHLQKQVIVLNLKHTFEVQWMSVALHELGHALGLEHSCDERERGLAGYVGCRHIGYQHPYRLAVLFPFLERGASPESAETKETLGENDEERAYCLYRRFR